MTAMGLSLFNPLKMVFSDSIESKNLSSEQSFVYANFTLFISVCNYTQQYDNAIVTLLPQFLIFF